MTCSCSTISSMRTEVISSAWTPLAKFVFGPAAICLFSWQFWMIIKISFETPQAFSPWYLFLAVPASMAAAFYFVMTRVILLCKVGLLERELVVSNYFNETVIPFTDIKLVKGRAFPGPEVISISFNRSTEAGDRIVFMPKGRRFDFWTKHPLVSRLEDYASGSVNLMVDSEDDFSKLGKPTESPFRVRAEDRGRILPPLPQKKK